MECPGCGTPQSRRRTCTDCQPRVRRIVARALEAGNASYREIAEELGLSLGAIQQRASRARRPREPVPRIRGVRAAAIRAQYDTAGRPPIRAFARRLGMPYSTVREMLHETK
jgi:transposase